MRKAIARLLVAALLATALLGLLSGGSASAERCVPSAMLEICIDTESGLVIGASGTEGVVEVSVLRGDALVTGLQAVNVNGTEIAVLLACDGDSVIAYINPRGQFGEGTVIDTTIPCP